MSLPQKNQRIPILLLILLLLPLTASSQCCLSFTEGVCILCPQGMHLYRTSCIYDLPGCASYNQGFDCASCTPPFVLEGAVCIHPRITIEKAPNYAPFLSSNLHPDPTLDKTRAYVENYTVPWVEWYNYTQITRNKTLLSKTTLLAAVASIRQTVLGKTPVVHFVYYSSIPASPPLIRTVYRLTYLLAQGTGYADITTIAQTSTNTSELYIQINDIVFNEVGSGNWQLVKNPQLISDIQSQLVGVFTDMQSQAFMEAYFNNSAKGQINGNGSTAGNYTLFYMDTLAGVVAYHYEMAADQTYPQSNHSNVNNTTPVPNIEVNETHNEIQNVTSISLDNLASNPIFTAGYAVAVQKYGILSNENVVRLFEMGSPASLYGIDFQITSSNSSQFKQILFRIDPIAGQFQVISFGAYEPPVNNTNNTNSNTNKTTASSIPINTTQKTVEVASISTGNTSCANSGQIDLDSDQQQTDMFLPRINLLLRSLYPSALANTGISDVKYSWKQDDTHLVTSMIYQLTYLNTLNKTLQFQVQIVNNQLSLLSVPTNISNTSTNDTSTTDSSPINSTSNISTKNNSSSQSDIVKNQTITPNSSSVSNNSTKSTKQVNNAINNPQVNELQVNITISNNPTAKNNQQKANSTSTKAPISQNTTNAQTHEIIPAQNYTTDPKLKSLVNILKSLYRIPSNSSVESMQTWKDQNQNIHYIIVFVMPLLPLNSTQEKVTTYELQVNSSSFVTVLSVKNSMRNLQSINQESSNNTNITSGSNHSSASSASASPAQNSPSPAVNSASLAVNSALPAEKSALPVTTSASPAQNSASPAQKSPSSAVNSALPAENSALGAPAPNSLDTNNVNNLQSHGLSLTLTAQTSPYLKQLQKILSSQCPRLKNYSAKSLKLSTNNDLYFSPLITGFEQTVMMVSPSDHLCYDISYFVSNFNGKEPQAHLLGYKATNCSSVQSQLVLSELAGATFVDVTIPSDRIDQRLFLVTSGRAFNITVYKQYSRFYWLEFSGQGYGDGQLFIDSDNLNILLFNSVPLLIGSGQNSTFSMDLVERHILKYYPNQQNTILLSRQLNPLDQEVILIQVLAKIQSSTFPILFTFSFRVIANSTTLLNRKDLNIDIRQTLSFLIPDLNGWNPLPVDSLDTITKTIFPDLLTNYPYFMAQTILLQAFLPQSLINQSITNQIQMKIIVAKPYTQKYSSFYLLEVGPGNTGHEIKSAGAVFISSIQMDNCQNLTDNIWPFSCATCQNGYRLYAGLCFPLIPFCERYEAQVCVECELGYWPAQGLKSCETHESEAEIITNVLNSYLVAQQNADS